MIINGFPEANDQKVILEIVWMVKKDGQMGKKAGSKPQKTMGGWDPPFKDYSSAQKFIML